MTSLVDTAGGALRRVAECVLMALGVPVTRDMPVDAVFLPNEGEANARQPWGQAQNEAFNVNPATGLRMCGDVDVLGNEWGSLLPPPGGTGFAER